jgi:acyl carrier protein
MTVSSKSIVGELRVLPATERAEALESIVVAEFRAALLMSDEDELPFDQSFFDLGLTSLGITDLKQRLERFLACEIDANVLFNSPTVERLLDHLDGVLFTEPRPSHEEPTAAVLDRELLGAALSDLYEQR